jgi:hypothetical protein
LECVRASGQKKEANGVYGWLEGFCKTSIFGTWGKKGMEKYDMAAPFVPSCSSAIRPYSVYVVPPRVTNAHGATAHLNKTHEEETWVKR